MMEDLLKVLGEKAPQEEQKSQKPGKRLFILLRFRTSVKDKKGKPYYVFILKGFDKWSYRVYSTDRNFILNETPFGNIGAVMSHVRVIDREDDGRAAGWLKDKLSGLIQTLNLRCCSEV